MNRQMYFHEKALEAATKKLAATQDLEAAILAYLESAHFQHQYAVPCLDRPGCRRSFNAREHAIAFARTEKVSVIEHRTVSPWVPDPDYP